MTKEQRSIGLGCAALAGIALALGGALTLVLGGARGNGSRHELVIGARGAGSIEVAEAELCPRLERAVPAELATFSEASEDGCAVHVPVSPVDAVDLAERVRAGLSAEPFDEPPWIQRVEPGRPLWVIAAGAPREGARVLDDLAPDIQAIAGVASVEICGPEPGISVRIDPSAIAARALSVRDVIAALSGGWPAGIVIARDDRAVRAGSLEETLIAPGTQLRDVASIAETAFPRACDAAEVGEAVAAMRVDLSPWDIARTLAVVRAVIGERARIVEPDRSLRVAAAGEIETSRISELVGALVHRDGRGLGVEATDPGVEERIARIPGLVVVHAGHDVARLWLRRDADVDEITRRVGPLGLVVAPLAAPGGTEIAATIDRERAARLGVSAEEIAASVSAWRGVELRDEDGRRVQVRLDVADTVEALAEIVVPTRDRGVVRLVEVASLGERAADRPRHRRRGAAALGLLVSARAPRADREALARALEGLDVEIEPL